MVPPGAGFAEKKKSRARRAERDEVVAKQTAEEVAAILREFLLEHPGALLLEDGRVLFDLGRAQYEIVTDRGVCRLQVWSEERNLFRTVLSAEPRPAAVRLKTARMGQTRPQTTELRDEGERRAPSTRECTRVRFVRVLERVLERAFPDERAEGFRTAMDLQRSFGPAYARGTLVRGTMAWAVVAVNGEESQATVDGALTTGILWLAHCRERAGGRRLYQGLRLVVPKGAAGASVSRMAWLDPKRGGWELYELDERAEELNRRELDDSGNLVTRLVHAPNEEALPERFGEGIARVKALLPRWAEAQAVCAAQAAAVLGRRAAHSRLEMGVPAGAGWEMRLRSSAELVFLRHGLEFARVKSGYRGESFNRVLEVTVGGGVEQEVLTPANEPAMQAAVRELFLRRQPGGVPSDPLFRSQAEYWLESVVRAELPELDAQLQAAPVYTQVPALAGGGRALERGMLDLLGVTRENRLAVIELKAEEDMHLPLQGLDYWVRVRFHQRAKPGLDGLGDLQRHGYFGSMRLSAEAPKLYLVAPALRIHPATETILRHFDPRVDWTLVALDERWRARLRPVWRRRSAEGAPA